MDGVLIEERPLWMEMISAKYRIENDLSHNTELVNKLNEVLNIVINIPQFLEPADTPDKVTDVVTQAFAGMTSDEIANYVLTKVTPQPHPYYDNLTYSESFYKPMVEVVQYLRANNFTVYILSGSETNEVRGVTKSAFPDLPEVNTIGAYATRSVSGFDSKYSFSGSIVHFGGITAGDVGVDRVYRFDEIVGERPVFSFGNSESDFPFMGFTSNNPHYKSCVFLLKHDDDERDILYNDDQQPKWDKIAADNSWGVVSVKEEFNQVFLNPNATRKLNTPSG